MTTSDLFESSAVPHLTEHLDAFVIVGYSADRHARFHHVHLGKDPACADGLQIFSIAATRWVHGSDETGESESSSKN